MRQAVRRTKIPDSGARLTTHHWALSTALNGALSVEMLKMKIEPAICMKTK